MPGVDGLWVSSEGHVRRYSGKHGWTKAHIPNCDPLGYRKTASQYVHRMVCIAFHGAQPTAKHTVDHINRDRSDNRAQNLRWADHSTQCQNQDHHTIRRTSKAVICRHSLWDLHTPSMRFASKGDACRALGLNSFAVTKACNRGSRVGVYTVKWEVHEETQHDLEGEEWRSIDTRTRISSCGRAQQKYPRGDAWAMRFTPKPTPGNAYAILNKKKFHRLVATEFLGPPPSVDHTVDHIDRNKSNNTLKNLRWLSKSGQVLNQKRKSVGPGNRDSQKKAVQCKRPGSGTWTLYESGHAASRAIHQEDGVYFRPEHVLQAARTECKMHSGYRFRVVPV